MLGLPFLQGVDMETGDVAITDYRGHNIAINPSNLPETACTDAFAILEPSANPMFMAWLHEHPSDEVKEYPSEEEARSAAMQLARAWIDAHLDQ